MTEKKKKKEKSVKTGTKHERGKSGVTMMTMPSHGTLAVVPQRKKRLHSQTEKSTSVLLVPLRRKAQSSVDERDQGKVVAAAARNAGEKNAGEILWLG